MRGYVTTLLLSCLFCISGIAQEDAQSNNFIGNIIEDYLESADAENFDYNTILENLQFYADHPLDINSVNEQELRDLFLLNEIQISNFISYRARFGNFLSIFELQAIPSWDLAIIRNLVPFMRCQPAASDFNLSFKDALLHGTSTLYLKAKRVMETRTGFIRKNNGPAPYAGDPNHLYLRYRYEFGQLFKAGFTAEKDPGESLFAGNNKGGFDFYSFFLYARNISRKVRIVTLGDFAVSLGQGLILHNDFATGKSSFVMNVKKSGRTIRPYSSVNEVNFFRGGGAIFTLGRSLEASAFASYKAIDATVANDTTENGDFDSFSTIRMDGFHRTASEIMNKNSIHQTNAGIKLQYTIKDFKLASNVLYTGFDRPLLREQQLYQKFTFSGRQLVNASIDYQWRFRNYTFFGEVATSDNGGSAQIHGLLLGLDRKIDMSFVYRKYDPDYQVLNANAFAEAGQPVNEKGLYLGMEIRPFRNVVISTYADIWDNPWVSYRKNGLTDGREFLLKFNYTVKRKMDFYVQYRYEQKQVNAGGQSVIDFPATQTLQRWRAHLSYRLSNAWELRERAEFSFFKKDVSSRGFMVYQDLLYKPLTFPVSFTARYALFDINSFDARIYAYENDMLYEFFVPFYQNRGSRWYINSRIKLGRHYTWEWRIGRTYLQDRKSIGSGNDFINGQFRTEIKTQLKITF